MLHVLTCLIGQICILLDDRLFCLSKGIEASQFNSFHEMAIEGTLICAFLNAASKIPIKIDGVRDFTFEEMASATNNFSSSALVGQGGYGKVYRGILADGTIVAIKRAQEGSLQGSKEFFTEIELLSRLHHRNLVSLLGYCDEETEQVFYYICNA